MSAQIDRGRTACLSCAGEPNYFAAVCINESGDEALWLINVEVLAGYGADDATHGDARQDHEQLGRLPWQIRDRIWGDGLRCGRLRANGQPCRQRVAEPGRACGVHQEVRHP